MKAFILQGPSTTCPVGTWGVFAGRHDFPTSPVFPVLPSLASGFARGLAERLGKLRRILLDPSATPLRYSANGRKRCAGATPRFSASQGSLPRCVRPFRFLVWGFLGSRPFSGPAVTSFLVSAAALLVLLAVGIAIIVKVRSWTGESSGNPDRWESTLADYRNLRNQGVLSDEEYRKIKTLVEPGGCGSVSSQGGTASEARPLEGDHGSHRDIAEPNRSDQHGEEEGGRSSEEDAPPA